MKDRDPQDPNTNAGSPEWADDHRLSSNYLDLVRLTLASAVIFGHSFDLLTGRMHSDPIGVLTQQQTSASSLAVDGFFSISGFLIAASFLRCRGWRGFLVRRIRRIYPGFAVANLVAPLAVVALGLTAPTQVSWVWEMVRHLGRTIALDEYAPPSPFPGNVNPSFNGSLWTIRYEFLCYLLCGAILAVRPRRRIAAAVVFLLFAATARSLLVEPLAASVLTTSLALGRPLSLLSSLLPSVLEERWLRFLLNYGAGMILYLNRSRIPRKWWLMLAFLLVSVWVAAFAPSALRFMTPLALTYFLFWVAFLPPTRATHMVRTFGDCSYGLYLYAFPIQQTIIAATHGAISPYALLAASLPATLVFAALSWWLIERPFLRGRLQLRVASDPIATA